MKGPLKRYKGLTWVVWINYLFLRWFCFRIAYTVENDNTISKWRLRWWPSWKW